MEKSEITKLLKATAKSAKITRLIAEENINVEYSEEADTAWYNQVTRTITYPYSMVMEDDDIHMLFVFHEVGHALYSRDLSLLESASDQGFQSFFNITEDIRIERLIKYRYPGVVKNFHVGYEKLMEKGFFGPQETIRYMSFPNRLNIYAKLGPINGRFIKFSQSETDFYNRCAEAKTEQDAYDLAKELHEQNGNFVGNMIAMYADMIHNGDSTAASDLSELYKKRVDDLVKEIDQIKDKNGDINDIADMIDTTQDDYGDSERNVRDFTLDKEQLERLAEALNYIDTVKVFDDNFAQTNIKNCSVVNFQSLDKKYICYYPASAYVSSVKVEFDRNQHRVKEMREMRDSFKIAVDSMVREFESRKAAFRHKNARISNTGMIDVNRLVGYKFTDEIFSKRIELADAKNHGFVIMLDCSGSIQSMFDPMCQQVIIMTEFFRRIGVHYRVFGYGMGVTIDEKLLIGKWNENSEPHQITSRQSGELLEFLNSDMNSSEHMIACTGMFNHWNWGFGDTPTVQALLQAEYLANEMFDKHKITKKKLINITDGEPSDTSYAFRHNSYYSSRNDNRPLLIIDSKTKKNYLIRRCSFSAPNAIGAVYKDRYDIDMINIGIGNVTMLNSFIGRSINASEKQFMSKNKFCEFPNPVGGQVFISRAMEVTTDIDGMNVDNGATVAQAAKSFIKELKKTNISRTFMNILAKNLSV